MGLLLAASGLGFFATAGAAEIGFAAARTRALTSAPDVTLAERRAELSQVDVRIAAQRPNPGASFTTARRTAKLGTSVSVPLQVFGQRGTAVDASRAEARAVTLDITATKREVLWSATTAWIDLWETQQRAKLLGLSSEDSQRLLHIAQEKLDAGAGARIDQVRARADRVRAEAEAGAARRAIDAAAARLAVWLGAAPEAPLLATGDPGYRVEAVPLDTLLRALVDHPALRRDRAQIEAAIARIRNEKRQRWPLVNAQVTFNNNDPTLPGDDVIVGLGLELPVFSNREGNIARARAEQTLATAATQSDLQRLGSGLLDAYRRTEGERLQFLALREKALPAISEARAMTSEGYAMGRIDLLRVLEAQKALLDTRLAVAGANASWARAVADLERAAGVDLGPGGLDAH
ncbi:MAG: TolC family protein [Candidatus Wallbacteria bacterium]|nr:TolC family protein [Candidatus Wallbacteria bacterium]